MALLTSCEWLSQSMRVVWRKSETCMSLITNLFVVPAFQRSSIVCNTMSVPIRKRSFY